MSPQACLNMCKRSCKWRLLTRQELWAKSEDRVIPKWCDFFSPLYIPTMWIFLVQFWKSFIYISLCHKHCPGENETSGEQEKWGFFWSDPEQLLLGSQRLVLTWGRALGLLLLCSPRNSCQKLRQLLLNMPLSFLLSLSPWSTPALAALWHPWIEKHTLWCSIRYL